MVKVKVTIIIILTTKVEAILIGRAMMRCCSVVAIAMVADELLTRS